MNRIKCYKCGLINSGSDELCRHCRINLHSPENTPTNPASPRAAPTKFAPTTTTMNNNQPKPSYFTVKIVAIIAIVVGGYFTVSWRLAVSKAQAELEEQQRQESMRRHFEGIENGKKLEKELMEKQRQLELDYKTRPR